MKKEIAILISGAELMRQLPEDFTNGDTEYVLRGEEFKEHET